MWTNTVKPEGGFSRKLANKVTGFIHSLAPSSRASDPYYDPYGPPPEVTLLYTHIE
jgi:hypothetical protein